MNNLSYALIMFFAGIGIPVMATLNSGLGVRFQSPVYAVVVLLSVGLTIATIAMLLSNGIPKSFYQPSVPWYFYAGGALFVFYILSVTAIAPRFGVGNSISFVLLGQIVAIAVIDHFGLFGATRFELSAQRLIGLVLMASGVLLVVRRI